MSDKKWLSWRVYYELSEINIAPLNIIWFILGASIAYKWYHLHNIVNVLLCLTCVFLFDLAVNIADNYYDYQHSRDEVFRTQTNPIGRLHLPLDGVKKLMWISYFISLIPGFILILRTGWPIFWIGVIGYIIGFFYSAGPKPINATIFCETAVALSISFLPVFSSFYVSIYGQLTLSWSMMGQVLLMCLPLTCLMFTIQLANNVCDLDEDRRSGRFTLANKLEVHNGLVVIKWAIIIGMLFPVFLFFIGDVHWIVLLSCLVLPLALKNLQPFFNHPNKKTTFLLVIKNCSLFFILYIALVSVTFIFF